MTPSTVFDRIVCGIDGTPESLEALRQAVAMAPPRAVLRLFHAVDLSPALSVAWAAPELAPAIAAGAGDVLEDASQLAPGASTHSVEGPASASLLDEIEGERATLVAVGTHGASRAEGIVLGTTTARMLHDAPCSVLVARTPSEGAFRPQRILVGIDGSRESELAAGAAMELADRLESTVTGLAALAGKDVHLDVARSLVADLEVDRAHAPVDALVQAAATADLLVVGSRGLHGLRALGSVSERVAHRAPCSVLVVRPH